MDGTPYMLGPLSRLNNCFHQLPTKLQKLVAQTGIQFPSKNSFHSIVARAIEIYYALMEAHRIFSDYTVPDETRSDYKVQAGVGYGCTEAPRGMLWHRYEVDEKGFIQASRIIPPTSQNQARIEADLRESLQDLGLDKGEDAMRLHSEMVVRNYDPCISCSTHFLTLNVDRKIMLKIIGIGSPFSDDRLGWEVINKLEQELVPDDKFALLTCDRPNLGLVNLMQGTEEVILIDAIRSGCEPGNLVRLNHDEIMQKPDLLSSHDFGVQQAIALAQALNELPPKLTFYGIEIGDLNYSEQLSSCITNAIPKLVTHIKNQIISRQLDG